MRRGEKEQMCKWAVSLSILLVIALFCSLSVGIANAGSYTYTLSGGPSSETPLAVDDDLEVIVTGKTVFIDDDRVSTYDGRATWKGAPITFSAAPGDAIQIIATNPGGLDIELSPLYLHVNGQSLKLSDGVPNEKNNTSEFFNERFIISVPTPLVSILDYSPSPVRGGEDLNVKVSWTNIPAGGKLVVSLEESEGNITRLADDVSKIVSGSGEETFKLKVYPTTETHGEAKVCACFYINEKGEWTGVFEKKNIMVAPKTIIIPPLIFGIIALIILIAGIFVVRRKMTSNTKQKPSRSRKLNRKTLSELSKLMAYILRHDKKQKFWVDLDENCYAKIDQLVKAISSRGKWRWVNRKHIEEVAAQSFYRGKRRFVIKEDKIKATYRITRKCPSTPTPPPKPTPSPSLEQKVKEEQISSSMPRLMSMPRLITIERAIYDPCKRDFVEGRLPRMKEWINRYDPGAYWFAISIQNDTDKAIEEWGVELEFSSALKIEEAKIEGIEIEIPHEAHLKSFKISVPKEYGIVIPKGGAQRIYFKLRAEKPKTTYEISGVFKSTISGDVLIRAKEFKYLCDTGVSPEAVKVELKKTFSEKDAARLANTFRIVQEIRSSYCNTNTKAREINKEFDLLKMYFTESEFLAEIESIQRRINAELREDESLDEKHVEAVKDFCEKFTEMWIARFLR